MRPLRIAFIVLVAVIAVGLGIAAWNVPLVKNSTDAVQVSREDGGQGITVSATRAGDQVLEQPGIGPDLSAMKGHGLPFAIAIDTHTGDISHLSLDGHVFLRDSSDAEIPGLVKQLSVDEHHMSYIAVFPKVDSQGNPLDTADQKHLTLLVKNVGATPERVLQWNLASSTAGSQGIAGLRRLSSGFIALVAVLGGFLALLSPCVLHTTWIWATLVAGASTQEEVEHHKLPILRAGVVKAVLLFIAGFTVMYVVLGTLAGAIGSIASQTLAERLAPLQVALDLIAGTFMILFGLQVTALVNMAWMNRIRIPLPRFLKKRKQRTEAPAAFAMGLSMAVGCVTCVGGTVFLGLLAYLGTTSWYTGLEVSLLYSLGVALPILFLSLGLDQWVKVLRSSSLFRKTMAVASGGMLVAIGFLTLIGRSELAELGIFWVAGKLGIHLPGSIIR